MQNYVAPTTHYFFRDWAEYKRGFGDVGNDHWLGNDNIHRLTTQNGQDYELRIDMMAFDGRRAHVIYEWFCIDDESKNYSLHLSVFSTRRSSVGEFLVDNAF